MAGQPPPTGKQPLSFKTVPGRNKTQKWQQAKTYNYDGDDWGGYDPYDEYGHDAVPTTTPPPPSQPQYVPQSRPHRAPSFDQGDERRTFSGPSVYGDEARRDSPTGGNGRAGSNMSPSHSRPRDFTNPEQVPQPLSTRASPAPAAQFPPRKSSVSGSAPALADLAPPPPSAPSPASEKPLPFIRPSDIYKRIAEEREKERQSMDSSRPSIDSAQRETLSPLPAGGLASKTSSDSLPSSTSGRRPSLDPVAESGESEDTRLQHRPMPSLPAVRERPGSRDIEEGGRSEIETFAAPLVAKEINPFLPPVSRISGFGSDILGGFAPGNPTSTGVDQPSSTFQSTADRVFSSPVVATSRTDSLYSDPIQATPGTSQAIAAPSGSGLQHQPSAGFRSAVNRAFDRQDDSSGPPTPITRDNSQSVGSTSDISPIMSRVPSAATAEQRQQDRDTQVPTIVEEPSRTSSIQPQGPHGIPRKPSPSHSRTPSGENGLGNVPAGYRRNLDPPSSDNSPARSPALEDTSNRRLSMPMSAETIAPIDTSGVKDLGADIPAASSDTGRAEPLESRRPSETVIEEYTKALPIASRGRSGTNYSLREADLANVVNASPEDGTSFSPIAAEARKESEQQFLRDHAASPVSPMSPVSATATGLGIVSMASSQTPGSGRNSPTKGRVREIAGQYHELETSRRNSQSSFVSNKSSWSNFRGSDENLALNRKDTDISQAEHGVDSTAGEDQRRDAEQSRYGDVGGRTLPVPVEQRPGLATQDSFVPHLPGEWISAAPTPSSEEAPVSADRTLSPTILQSPHLATSNNEEIDLTPTTKKSPLQRVSQNTGTGSPSFAFQQVKDIGTALSASLMSTAGLNSQSRDFASQDPAPPVQHPEMEPHPVTGEVFSHGHPPLHRYDSEAASSVADSVPPTPPVKDMRHPTAATSNSDQNSQPKGGYFANASDATPSDETQLKQTTTAQRLSIRPAAISMLSTDTGSSDYESDRLRKEIMRSLDPPKASEIESERMSEDMQRGQQPADVPALATTSAHQGPQPGLLTQRYSWEEQEPVSRNLLVPSAISGTPAVTPSLLPKEAEKIPEVLPEMPYERPRSRGLHIMNRDDSDEESDAMLAGTSESSRPVNRDATAMSPQPSATPDTRDALALPVTNHQGVASSQTTLHELSPSALSDRRGSKESSMRLPSYYTTDPSAEVAALATIETPNDPIPEADSPSTSSAANRRSDGKRIPPFREILAIKSSGQRTDAYNNTRETFAHMDTGLSDWLSGMLLQNPEHASLSTAPPGGYKAATLQSSTNPRHKASPSIIKFTKQFTDGGERKTSVGGGHSSMPQDSTSNLPAVDMEKMQQRGKELMKSAGVFGGKAQAGAKGLFAKGKSRFGTLKRDGADGSGKVSTRASRRTPESRDLAPVIVPSDSSTRQPAVATTMPLQPPAVVSAETISDTTVAPHGAASADSRHTDTPTLPVPASKQSSGLRSSFEGETGTHSTILASSASMNAAATSDEGGMTASIALTAVGTAKDIKAVEPKDDTDDDEALLPRINRDKRRMTLAEFLASTPTSAHNDSKHASRDPPPAVAPALSIPSLPRSSVVEGSGDVADHLVSSPNLSPSTSISALAAIGTPPQIQRENTQSPLTKQSKRLSMSHAFTSRPFSMFRARQSSTQSHSEVRPTRLVNPDQDTPIVGSVESASIPVPVEAVSQRADEFRFAPQRVESWNESDAMLPSKDEAVSRDSLITSMAPTRLGVLPSPAVDSFPISNGLPWKRTALDVGPAPEMDYGMGQYDEDSAAMEEGTGSPMSSTLFVTPPMTRAGLSSPSSPRTPQRPEYEGKVSAIAELPSQRRAGSQTLARPISGFGQLGRLEQHGAQLNGSRIDQGPFPIMKILGEDKNPYNSISTPSSLLPPVGTSQQALPIRDIHDPDAMTEEPGPITHSEVDPHHDQGPVHHGVELTTGAEQEGLPEPQMTPLNTTAALQSAPHLLRGKKSDVSAEDIRMESFVHHPQLEPSVAASRRSSVSSLHEADLLARPEHGRLRSTSPVMSSQADPAGLVSIGLPHEPTDVSLPIRASASERNRFMDRPYKWSSGMNQDPPVSQISTPQDYVGPTPLEGIEIHSGGHAIPAHSSEYGDLSNAAFSPPQQSTAVNAQSVEHDILQSPALLDRSITPSSAPRANPEDSARRSRRFSNFFRGSDRNLVPSQPIPAIVGAPPPHQVHGSFDGLEGLETSGPSAVIPTKVHESRPPQETQSKRRSGIMDTFKRSPSVSNADFGKDDTYPVYQSNIPGTHTPVYVATNNMAESISRPKTLKKLQRASSAALSPVAPTGVEPSEGAKKQRFSSFGSLFGRSNTSTGRSSPRPNKLTKRPEVTNQAGPGRPNIDSGHGGSSYDAYEAYEALRLQQAPGAQQRRGSEPDAPLHQFSGPRRAATARAFVPPVPEGWRGSREVEQQFVTEQAPPLRRVQPFPPQGPPFRRLHSAGDTGRREQRMYGTVPEAFTPVEASYGMSAAPIGPPPGHRPSVVYQSSTAGVPHRPYTPQPTLPTQQPYWTLSPSQGQVPIIAPPQPRQTSFTSSGDNSTLQDVDWRHSGTTPGGTSFDPRTRSEHYASQQSQDQWAGSSNEETARSPAREYADQQTPWSVTLPNAGGEPDVQQDSSLRGDDAAQQHGARYAHRTPNLPMSPRSPQSYVPSGMPPGGSRVQSIYHDPSLAADMADVETYTNPTPPYSPESPPAHHGVHAEEYRYPSPHIEQQQVFEESSRPASGQRHPGSPKYLCTQSGFSGRRDNIAMGEDEIHMRGSSYPSHEWSPTGQGAHHTWE